MIHYCITDPKYFSSSPSILEEKLLVLQNSVHFDFICFRDKSSTNFEELANVFVKTMGDKTTFLNGDYKLAKKLNYDGVHLTSTQFSDIKKAKELHLQVIVSTHTRDEIKEAVRLGADYVTYSPIFSTPNKGTPKGLEDLKETIATIPAKIIALGGITTKEQVQSVENSNAFGFASIRYFLTSK